MGENSYKRKQFKVLDKAVQKDIYKWLIGIWLAWFICQSLFAVYFLWLSNKNLLNNNKIVIVSFFIFSTLLFIALLFSMNHFVNKFLGPIYRIRQDLEKAKRERKDINITLRKNDYFKDVAEQLNTMKFKDQ